VKEKRQIYGEKMGTKRTDMCKKKKRKLVFKKTPFVNTLGNREKDQLYGNITRVKCNYSE